MFDFLSYLLAILVFIIMFQIHVWVHQIYQVHICPFIFSRSTSLKTESCHTSASRHWATSPVDYQPSDLVTCNYRPPDPAQCGPCLTRASAVSVFAALRDASTRCGTSAGDNRQDGEIERVELLVVVAAGGQLRKAASYLITSPPIHRCIPELPALSFRCNKHEHATWGDRHYGTM